MRIAPEEICINQAIFKGYVSNDFLFKGLERRHLLPVGSKKLPIPQTLFPVLNGVRQAYPVYPGQEYCDCMRKYNAKSEGLLAYRICHGETFKRFRYYRIRKFYAIEHTYTNRVSDQAKDR